MFDNAENIKSGNDHVTVKYASNQGIINLSESHKIKTFSRNESIHNDKKDEKERDSAVDKVNQSNMVTKENIGKEKIDANAWRNLKYMVTKQAAIKHKLPLMPPPERDRNNLAQIKKICKRNELYEQRKDVFDVEIQTDAVNFVTEEDYELIQYIKNNAITKEAIMNLAYYDDDGNNKMENQSKFEQESVSHAEAVPVPEGKRGGEEQKVDKLIEKYSEENKTKLSNLFGPTDKKKSDNFSGTNFQTKKHFLEYIINSMWQLVIYMSRHMEMVEKEEEKIKPGVHQSVQTSPEVANNKKDENKVNQTTESEEIKMSQLSSQMPTLDMSVKRRQRMQVIHGYYEKLPPHTTSRPNDLRGLSQQYQRAEYQPQKQLIKKPRLNLPDTHEYTTINSLNNQMQFGNSSQFGGETTRVPSHWHQRYHSNMPSLQWFNVMPPPLPPLQRYNEEHRFTNQQTSAMGQYQGPSQQQEMSEYRKNYPMEMQKKAWESQLQNYPNSAWSHPVVNLPYAFS